MFGRKTTDKDILKRLEKVESEVSDFATHPTVDANAFRIQTVERRVDELEARPSHPSLERIGRMEDWVEAADKLIKLVITGEKP